MSFIPNSFCVNEKKEQPNENSQSHSLLSTRFGAGGDTLKFKLSKAIYTSVRVNNNKIVEELGSKVEVNNNIPKDDGDISMKVNQCDICGKYFKNLKVHISKKHPLSQNNKMIMCKYIEQVSKIRRGINKANEMKSFLGNVPENPKDEITTYFFKEKEYIERITKNIQ